MPEIISLIITIKDKFIAYIIARAGSGDWIGTKLAL